MNALKRAVLEANLRIVREGLVTLTWGNVSAIDREKGFVAIKPSGVPYEAMRSEDIVVVRLSDGGLVEGTLRPSSDLPTHLELYRHFKGIGAIVHTHSLYATVWAQAGKELPPYGTTHADHFYGAIPVTRAMKNAEISDGYEVNTGKVIVERFRRLDPMDIPAVLVRGHAPFVWGVDLERAVHNAVVLERVAHMASETLALQPRLKPMPQALLDKHFKRKHGSGAYYGQRKG